MGDGDAVAAGDDGADLAPKDSFDAHLGVALLDVGPLVAVNGDGRLDGLAIGSGLVKLDGEEACDDEEYRKKTGFVFQQGGLFLHLSALENITLPLEKVHGLTKQKARERAFELLSRFGLTLEADKRPAQLSGGQKQRISIARAVAPKPKILLLDEPTSALDPEYTTEVLDMIRELKDEKLSFIIATHEMGFAYHACDKVIFMSEGSVLEAGKSKEVFTKPGTPELKEFLSKLLEWKV